MNGLRKYLNSLVKTSSGFPVIIFLLLAYLPSCSRFLISDWDFLICFSLLALALTKPIVELHTVQANPATAVDPISTGPVTKPTAMRVAPPTMPNTAECRAKLKFLTYLSRNCGSFPLAAEFPIRLMSRQTKTWQFLKSTLYFCLKVLSHTSQAV